MLTRESDSLWMTPCEMCENGEPCVHCLGAEVERLRSALTTLRDLRGSTDGRRLVDNLQARYVIQTALDPSDTRYPGVEG